MKKCSIFIIIIFLYCCKDSNFVDDKGSRVLKRYTYEDFLILKKSTDRYERINAAEGIGKLSNFDNRLLPHLLDLARDKDFAVNETATKELGEFGPRAKSILPDLLNLLKENKANSHTGNTIRSIINNDDILLSTIDNLIQQNKYKKNVLCSFEIGNPSDKIMDYYSKYLCDDNLKIRSCVANNISSRGHGLTKEIYNDCVIEIIQKSKNTDDIKNGIQIFYQSGSVARNHVNKLQNILKTITDKELKDRLQGAISFIKLRTLEEFCYSCMEIIGSDKNKIINKFGKPLKMDHSSNKTKYGNVEEEFHIKYKDLDLNYVGKETYYYFKYIIEKPEFQNIKWNIGISSTEDDVLKLFGEPNKRTNNSIEYSGNSEGEGMYSIVFYFKNNSVVKIEASH